jgi:hypothetical protein
MLKPFTTERLEIHQPGLEAAPELARISDARLKSVDGLPGGRLPLGESGGRHRQPERHHGILLRGMDPS